MAEIGKRLGRKGLAKVAQVAKPDTILVWFRKLVAQKFDGSKHRSYPGRPRIDAEVESLIVQMARENSGWGYDRIAGALANLGYAVSDQTIGTCCAGTGSRPLRDGVRRRHGRTSSPHIWQSWQVWISLPLRCPPGVVWRLTMFCLSSNWKHGA